MPTLSSQHSFKKVKIGFVGWRGIVGSVLLQRMQEEGDFSQPFEARFFSTSQAMQPGPNVQGENTLLDAFDVQSLKQCTVIVSAQGSDYSKKIYPALQANNWDGYWVDASSAFRQDNDAVIVLDPINQPAIDAAIKNGVKKYIGGNCTVSLMLMAIGGLLPYIEHIHAATYQAFSGAGAATINAYLKQMQYVASKINNETALEKTAAITQLLNNPDTHQHTHWPLVGNLLPWIDSLMDAGTTKEEWKGQTETNKIIAHTHHRVDIDTTCVRVGVLRCHSQALHITLNTQLTTQRIEDLIQKTSPWTHVIKNNQQETEKKLHPLSVSGTLNIHVGRIRLLTNKRTVGVFCVGDQLLWGAAEPLRRIILQLLKVL